MRTIVLVCSCETDAGDAKQALRSLRDVRVLTAVLSGPAGVHTDGPAAALPRGLPSTPRSFNEGVEALSRREREIFHLIAAGHCNKRIVAEIGVAASSVGTYIQRIYTKLGLDSRAELLLLAGRLGPGANVVGEGPPLPDRDGAV